MIYICYISVITCLLALSLHLYKKVKRHNANINGVSLKSFINSIPIGVYLRDLKGKIILANKEFAKLAGYPLQEIINKNIYDIEKTHDFLKDEKLNTYIEKEINSHHYEIIKTPLFDHRKNVIGVINMIKNIDKEHDAKISRSNFIASLTHDIKSPSSAQINMLNLLINGAFGELNPKQREIIELIASSCKQVSKLASTVVETYSNNCGHLILKPESFDIVKITNSICKELKTLAESKMQNIVLSCINKPYNITADKLQIRRVIMNLVSNSIKYGTSDSEIKLTIIFDKDNIEFIVQNEGIYIPPQEIETIFDRFKRTQFSSLNSTGTGLGLYICKQIINLHNGKISAQSFENGTCIFRFKIPNSISQSCNSNTEQIHTKEHKEPKVNLQSDIKVKE